MTFDFEVVGRPMSSETMWFVREQITSYYRSVVTVTVSLLDHCLEVV